MDRRDEHDVIDQLAREVQAQEARMLPEKGELTPEQIDYARQRVAGFIREKSITYKQVSKEVGPAESTLSQFFTGSYQGDNAKLARTLVRWMRGREDGHRVGMPLGFVTTSIVRNIEGVIAGVKKSGTMGAIVGPSGCSKSMVCQALIAGGKIPGTIYIELTSVERSRGAVIGRIADVLKIKGRSRALPQVLRAIIDELSGSHRLILIDEAHFLTKEALNVLRDIHKQAMVPLMLIGTNDVLKTMNDFDEFRGQLHRLVSFVYDISAESMDSGDPLFTVDEIVEFGKTMELRLTGDAAEFLTDLCNILGWGGLGRATMVLLSAKILAQGGKVIDLDKMRRALRSVEGITGFKRVELKTSSKKAKVA